MIMEKLIYLPLPQTVNKLKVNVWNFIKHNLKSDVSSTVPTNEYVVLTVCLGRHNRGCPGLLLPLTEWLIVDIFAPDQVVRLSVLCIYWWHPHPAQCNFFMCYVVSICLANFISTIAPKLLITSHTHERQPVMTL